jgi:hypothetical protein
VAISADIEIDRRQKAWFLPAAPVRGACGASAAISADIEIDRRPRRGAGVMCRLDRAARG